VEVGETVVEPEVLTAPMPEIVTEEALVVLQVSVAVCPACMDAGSTVKELITAGLEGVTGCTTVYLG